MRPVFHASTCGRPHLSTEKTVRMDRSNEVVYVLLSREEAYELLMRCLQSEEEDTPVFRNALRRLARAIESKDRGISLAA